MGRDYVLNYIFDPIRDSIIKKENLDDFYVDNAMPEWLVHWVRAHVPAKAHFVVLISFGSAIDAYVSFYREPLHSVIRLVSTKEGDVFKFGLVCDWQTHTEKIYRTDDFE